MNIYNVWSVSEGIEREYVATAVSAEAAKKAVVLSRRKFPGCDQLDETHWDADLIKWGDQGVHRIS